MSLIVENALKFDTNVLRNRVLRSLKPLVNKPITPELLQEIKKRTLRIATKWAEGSI
jgi:hypothetical protein